MDKSLSLSFEETGSQSCILNDFKHVPRPPKYEIVKKDLAQKAKKIRNFDKMYLKMPLWPDRACSAVRQEHYKSQQKILNLKKKINKENCENCQEYKHKLKSTKLSLFHALDLCSSMLKEISNNSK